MRSAARCSKSVRTTSDPGSADRWIARHATNRLPSLNVAVVDDVSFNVRPGEVTGYLGPNGSGKSTTIKMITTLLQPSRGHGLLDGWDVRNNLAAFKQRLGCVPEEPILKWLRGMARNRSRSRLNVTRVASAGCDRIGR